jgi:O-antigen/teichoic acid export membrane protein
LVLGNLIGAGARTAAKWRALDWRPRWRFYPAKARELWNYGVHILLFNLLSIALDQADQLLIGVLLGQLQLGYYAIAMKLPELIIANFSLMLTRVLFPAYAKLKTDVAGLSASFLATTRYTAYVTVPLGLGMAVVAPELMLVAFGEQWTPAIPLLRVLALMGLVSTLAWSAGDVLKALGRPSISTQLLLVESLFTFPLIFGLVFQTRLALMAAIANLIALSLGTLLRLGVITRFLEVKLWHFLPLFGSPFVAGAVMVLGVAAWRQVISAGPPLLILATAVPLGALIYVGGMWILERASLLEALATLGDTLGRVRTPHTKED